MASGDMNLNVAKVLTVSGLTLQSFVIDLVNAFMQLTFIEVATGTPHVVRLTDAASGCTGFDLTGGAFTDGLARAVSGEYTKLIGIIFGAGANTPNQRKTAATAALITDGVITGALTAV